MEEYKLYGTKEGKAYQNCDVLLNDKRLCHMSEFESVWEGGLLKAASERLLSPSELAKIQRGPWRNGLGFCLSKGVKLNRNTPYEQIELQEGARNLLESFFMDAGYAQEDFRKADLQRRKATILERHEADYLVTLGEVRTDWSDHMLVAIANAAGDYSSLCKFIKGRHPELFSAEAAEQVAKKEQDAEIAAMDAKQGS